MLTDLAAATAGFTPATWLFAAVVVFAAGFLRGFTGFGFALAAVPALTLIAEPADVVPAALIIQTLAGLQLLHKIWRQVDWMSLRLLLAGALCGTPFGSWLLAVLSADLMRAVIALVLLGAVLLLLRGFRLQRTPGRGARLAIGAGSGLLNGATAMGGPPVVIFFLALPAGVAVGRASLLMYFFFLSLASVAFAGAAGQVTPRVVVFSLLMFPLMFVGNALGDRQFARASDHGYKRVALLFLLGIAVVAITRAIVGAIG